MHNNVYTKQNDFRQITAKREFCQTTDFISWQSRGRFDLYGRKTFCSLTELLCGALHQHMLDTCVVKLPNYYCTQYQENFAHIAYTL
jgi:hypothetical protein